MSADAGSALAPVRTFVADLRAALGAGPTPLRGGVSRDELWAAIENRRRRAVVDVVADAGEPVELGDVAEQVASEVFDTPREDVSSQERKRVYVGLYQCHADRMDELGLVEYDQDGGTLAPSTNTIAAKRAIDSVRGVLGGDGQ